MPPSAGIRRPSPPAACAPKSMPRSRTRTGRWSATPSATPGRCGCGTSTRRTAGTAVPAAGRTHAIGVAPLARNATHLLEQGPAHERSRMGESLCRLPGIPGRGGHWPIRESAPASAAKGTGPDVARLRQHIQAACGTLAKSIEVVAESTEMLVVAIAQREHGVMEPIHAGKMFEAKLLVKRSYTIRRVAVAVSAGQDQRIRFRGQRRQFRS